jgi:hypothetical protein
MNCERFAIAFSIAAQNIHGRMEYGAEKGGILKKLACVAGMVIFHLLHSYAPLECGS